MGLLIDNTFHTPDVVLAEVARFKDAADYITHTGRPSRPGRLGAIRRYVDAAGPHSARTRP